MSSNPSFPAPESAGSAAAKSARDFRQALAERIVLCDGAMGTMIYAQGVYINQCFDNLNLIRPHLIKNIHNQYVQAGAEILETNTFGATEGRLAAHGLSDKVREINLTGARLAREASEGKTWTAGAIGPLAELMTPLGPLTAAEVRRQYTDAIRALLEGEVDLLLFESFDQIEMLLEGIRAARELNAGIPIVAQVRFGQEGHTRYGVKPEAAANLLAQLPVDCIGTNCGAGAEEVLDVVERMSHACNLPISAQPNIGFPRYVEDRLLYLATPEYLMEYTRRMIQKGARLIGACCGSTPDHIRSIRSSIRMLQPGAEKAAGIAEALPREASEAPEAQISAGTTSAVVHDRAEKPQPPPMIRPKGISTPSRLAARLRSGQFVISIEIDPPLGTDLVKSLEAARGFAATPGWIASTSPTAPAPARGWGRWTWPSSSIAKLAASSQSPISAAATAICSGFRPT